jgi:coenzyme F420-reducing hydrogenase alpha subunit
MAGPSKSLRVDVLSRVEGDGSMVVKVKDGRVTGVKLGIFEPPRFFEGLLRGRAFHEAPDITARICGICPVAYQLTACLAMEDACGIRVDGALRELRRLFYCGEWIESHALHVYMLHAPDFLGFESGLHLAREHPEVVARGLKLKKAGNDIVRLLGGREIHPVNACVGGFYRAPSRNELAPLVGTLEEALETAVATVRWVAGFTFPDFEENTTFVSLRHPSEYPMAEGRIVSSAGLDVAVGEFDTAFVEEQVAHSNSLHARLRTGGHYAVGPLARYNLNADRLGARAREAAREAGLAAPCTNPFRSIVVRAVELVFACEEALRILGDYRGAEPPSVAAHPKEGHGAACTEAPRGLLFHRYELAGDGTIRDARIVPPTSQNLATIEDDLARFAQSHLSLPQERLQWQCEQAVRNHDPCISCATHFVRIEPDLG